MSTSSMLKLSGLKQDRARRHSLWQVLGNEGEEEISINKGEVREPFLLSSAMQRYL